jgi:hypothetical protein
MNYSELTAAIKGYAENDFPDTVGSFTSATQIATFVKETEQRVFNAVQLLDLRKKTLLARRPLTTSIWKRHPTG